MATCSFKGCRKICQGQLCRRHYNAKRARKECSVEGCTGPAVTHGICEHHRSIERTEARQLARAKLRKNEVRRQKRAVKKEMTIREQERPLREDFYSRTYAHRPDVESESKREIDYRDETPKAFKVQIPLWEYFERVKRFKITRWQRHLADALQEAAEQRHVKRWLGLIHCEGQAGKPVSVDSLVLMNDGSYRRLGDIRRGDNVITHLGRSRNVKRVFDQGALDCVRIDTWSGRSTVAALDHPFLTPEGWINAGDLIAGQSLACVPEPETVPVGDWQDDDFELVGYFIGDGCVTSSAPLTNTTCIQANITSGDPVQAARILEITDRKGFGHRVTQKPGAKCLTYNFKNGVRDWIRSTGIAGKGSADKRVPPWVYRGTRRQIGLFLGAYFSCDGSLVRNMSRQGNFYDTRSIEFCSISKELLVDVQRLLLRLGIQSRLAVKNGRYNARHHISYRLIFASQDYNAQFARMAFVAGVKGQELAHALQVRNTFPADFLPDKITAVTPVGKVHCKCLEVAGDHTFTSDDFVVHNTTLISHCFPAWCIGHNPLFRFALAMYNQSRSQQHSLQVIEIMQSKLHKDIFPDEAGWIRATAAFGKAETVAKSGWYTQARWDAGDMQFSFNPVGLLSGLTGSSADWLGLDDPYRDAKDAFSQLINQGMHNFWEYTVVSRLSEHTCVSGMFHRYAPDDFAGYLLDKGNFEYLRYASQCDGDYIHPNTGQKFPDPIGRKEGEYLMPERRPSSYYNEAKKNKRVWLSMYQGRPSDEEGEMFSVGKIHIIDGDELQLMKDQVSVWGRGYDIASTEEAGAYTVGWHAGMLPDGRILFDDMYRKRVDTAARQAAMKSNAARDGADCLISIPVDPGAAGKSVVAYTEAEMEGFTIVARTTTDNKVQRALNFSIACNSGKVYFAKTHQPMTEIADDRGGVTQVPDKDWVDWNYQAKKELREFPLSDYKDITDAGADIYNTLFEATRRGLVVKNYKPQRNLVTVEQFRAKFKLKELKIPEKWTIYAGAKISQEASRATSAVIVARASAHAALPEVLFVLDEYKAYDANMYALFDWLTERVGTLCDGRDVTVWLHGDSEQYYQTIASKLDFRVTNFPDDQLAGLNELNWYLLPTEEAHPFGNLEHAAHLYFLTSSDQFSDAIKDKEHGFYHCRQEMATWGFTDKGDPTKVGDVADCLRMITHRFKTYEEAFTFEEELDIAIKKHMPPEGPMTHARQQQLTWARHLAKMEMMEKHGEDVFDSYNEVDPSGYEEEVYR